MVKKSKKSKSKRITLRKKHKVLRKVKEHHKKKAKEAKKLGLKRRKVEKDPGIPNEWPFKEQELKALEERRARAIEELEQKKAARKERAQKRKLGLLEEDVKEADFGEEENKNDVVTTGKKRDNSDRAFYKELVKVVEVSDVILEVLDARDPLGTRCTDMEKMVMKAGSEKHIVLVLNKIDLVPKEAVEKWLKYLREETAVAAAVAFKCSTQEQRSNLGWKSSSKAAKSNNPLQTSDCLGAETLIKLLKSFSKSYGINKSITVGVIGLPNVGKSSLINSLKRSHVVNVGATPGLTRSMQEVHLDKDVKLLDCPGVVMLKSSGNDAAVILKNCKRIEKLEDPVAPVKEILKLCPAEVLVTIYKLPTFETVDDFLQKMALVRGKLKKGGIVDVEAVARIVLHDWNEGKIPYYTMPPRRKKDEVSEVKIVTEFSKKFDIDEVYNGESSFIGSLRSFNEFNPVEVPPSCPVQFDESMLEEDAPSQASTRDDKNSDPMADGDEAMTLENDAEESRGQATTSSRQNEKLYTAEGILNPKTKRAEKKRRKKAKSSGEAMDEDYDFKVDYRKKSDGIESDNAADDITGEVPMSGVELDE